VKLKWYIFFLFFAHPELLSAQYLRVSVYEDHALKSIEFAYVDGEYDIYADSNYLVSILPNEFVGLRLTSEKQIELNHGVRKLGRFDAIYIKPKADSLALRLRPRIPQLKTRKYQGGMHVQVINGRMRVINVVRMEDYIAGVVESEGGGGKHLEYYKAQAVLSRTYALKHMDKHKEEGFHLCDRVHCQAYHQMLTYTSDIRKAVKETIYQIVVDSSGVVLIDGYFHANCGGQTSHSGYVWNKDIAYLQPFSDTFCIHTKQASWDQRILKSEWKKFLINNYHFPITDSTYANQLYTFRQPYRKAFLYSPHLGIPLRDVRLHFKLKSTFFDIYSDGEYVLLKGKGYGHGVGLCQEGAMNMAKSGLNYAQILRYYFQGSRIKNYLEEVYFRQDDTKGLTN
jgi:stage II sporulation protein D